MASFSLTPSRAAAAAAAQGQVIPPSPTQRRHRSSNIPRRSKTPQPMAVFEDDEAEVPMRPAFPAEALVPKCETNASAFVAAHPEYDGRGVTVGILDTGVDPGAAGMGNLVDVVDCTGSGDVDVSTEARARRVEGEDEGEGEGWWWEVEGLSGRTLRLSPGWNICPFPGADQARNEDQDQNQGQDEDEGGRSAGEDKEEASAGTVPVRLGIKRAYELFPSKLVRRLEAHRAVAFEAAQAGHAAEVRARLASWHGAHPDAAKATRAEVREREELASLLAVLELGAGSDEARELCLSDPGPLYDCVVYHDGERYRAAIDAGGHGDLTSAAAGMTDYAAEREFRTFGSADLMNYAVNFYDGGRVLSIVCDAGAHGSHVAGIAAGRQTSPGDGGVDGSKSGAAPGADIISFKIGDTRLGSMETGTALTRAMIGAVRKKCDVINLSYGEGAAVANSGRFVRLAEDLVHRHGVVFVSSAGNNGPALSTVGAPGGTSSALIGVAAYVSPDMMRAEYGMMTSAPAVAGGGGTEEGAADAEAFVEDATNVAAATESNEEEEDNSAEDGTKEVVVGTTYTWSSVGPAVDGDNGVDLTAPGGAITSVPNWTLQKSQLMNGTSMSSPHATGCVALLLSACKANGIEATPARISRALKNSAKTMAGLSCLQQGAGMIQVDKAWEYLLLHRDDPDEDIHFDVHIDNRAGSPRGVYLRQPEEVSLRQTYSVSVDPRFRKDAVDMETQRRRVDFEMRFNLEATAPWVRSPDHLMLMHNGRSFKFEVDPTSLPPGVHTARIHGYDSSAPSRGPMFSVPITVAKPLEEKQQLSLGNLSFEPAEVKRFFLSVPEGATWMDVSIKDKRVAALEQDSSPRLVVLHTVQLVPNQAYRDAEKEVYLNLVPSQTSVTSIPVLSGITCELAVARYWSATGITNVDVSVEFRGTMPSPQAITLVCGGGGGSVTLYSKLRNETVQPSAKLTKWSTALTPKSEGVVSPLGDRDVWPSENKRIYQLILTYEFKQEEGGSFVARAPSLQGKLYESAYESQLMLIYDSEKRLLGTADSWPSAIKAPKGDVLIRLQIRHGNPSMLEKLRDLEVWIERKLSKDIELSVYPTHESKMAGKGHFRKRILRKGSFASVIIAEPDRSKLQSGVKCGDIIEGSITYEAGSPDLPGTGKRPDGYQVQYIVGPKMEARAAADAKGVAPELPDERSVQERIDEAVRALKVTELKNLSKSDKDKDKFEEAYTAFRIQYPEHLPLLCAGLNFYDHKERREKYLEKVVEVADSIIHLIPEAELAAHFGLVYDQEDPKSCKEHKEMEEKKKFLIEALARKARAVADDGKSPSSRFDDALKHLSRWLDVDSDLKYAVLIIERGERAGRMGAVLKLLNDLLKKNGDDTKGGICPMTKSDLLGRRAKVLDQLGFSHLSENDMKWRVIASPKSFALF